MYIYIYIHIYIHLLIDSGVIIEDAPKNKSACCVCCIAPAELLNVLHECSTVVVFGLLVRRLPLPAAVERLSS